MGELVPSSGVQTGKSVRVAGVIHGLRLPAFPAAMEAEARLVGDFYKMLLELLRKKHKKDEAKDLTPLVVSGCLEAADCYRHYHFCAVELRENWKKLKFGERCNLSKSMADYASKCRAAIRKLGLSAKMDTVGDDMDMGDDEADDE